MSEGMMREPIGPLLDEMHDVLDYIMDSANMAFADKSDCDPLCGYHFCEEVGCLKDKFDRVCAARAEARSDDAAPPHTTGG